MGHKLPGSANGDSVDGFVLHKLMLANAQVESLSLAESDVNCAPLRRYALKEERSSETHIKLQQGWGNSRV